MENGRSKDNCYFGRCLLGKGRPLDACLQWSMSTFTSVFFISLDDCKYLYLEFQHLDQDFLKNA